MLSLSHIPLKNIKTHRFRSVLLFTLMIFLTFCLCLIFSLFTKMKSELSLSQKRFGADVIVYPYVSLTKISSKKLLMQGNPVCSYLPLSYLDRIKECEHIKESSYQVYIKDETGEKPLWIVGLEKDKDFVIYPWLRGGKKVDLTENGVFLGSRVTETDGKITLFENDFTVLSRLDETGSELDEIVFVSMETLKNLISLSKKCGVTDYEKLNPFKQFSSLLIKTDGENYVDGVFHWINLHVRKVVATRSEATLVASSSGIKASVSLVMILSFCVWLILLFSLFIAQGLITKERKKEFFVWFTAGASRKIISRVMIKEAFLVFFTGSVFGFAAFFVYLLASKTLFSFSLVQLFAFFTLSVLISTFMGILSSYFSIKLTVKDLDSQMLLEL